MSELYTYDIENYPNCFTLAAKRLSDGARWLFELSFRKDDSAQLWAFLQALHNDPTCAMPGFNNIGYDYVVIHEFIKSEGTCGQPALYAKNQAIFASYDRFAHTVWESDWFIPQLDLYKINHFDNQARSTSLKQIEFNKRVTNLMDLPFPPGTMLTSDQIDMLIHYNMFGDVDNTEDFLIECMPAIEFRRELSAKYGRSFMNDNDTKIGKQYFIMSLEAAGVPCYIKQPGQGKMPIQTPRASMALKDAVLPMVHFRHPEFNRIHQWFLEQVITETKGTFKDVSCTVNNFTYDFGLGGIHGSIESQTVHSDDEWIVEDWDVASYYPNLAIANRVYPEHLGEEFCDIYQDVYLQRKQHPKGSPENAVMKLALNGVYGDSNSKYSPFYDPLYTMTITINGQLLLCMLAENLHVVPGLSMIQINTDGLTIRYRRKDKDSVHAICAWWEEYTKLELEHVEYAKMLVRDVNNYIAVGVDGKVKRKGAYEHERGHHQNHSALVVPKVAEMALLQGVNIEDTVRNWPDVMDFMMFCKSAQADILELRDGASVTVEQRRTRYYVTDVGGSLIITRPPPKGKVAGDFKKANGVPENTYDELNVTGTHNPVIHTKNKSVYGARETEVEKGYKVTVANDIMEAVNPINYNYYIDRVLKLVEPLR